MLWTRDVQLVGSVHVTLIKLGSPRIAVGHPGESASTTRYLCTKSALLSILQRTIMEEKAQPANANNVLSHLSGGLITLSFRFPALCLFSPEHLVIAQPLTILITPIVLEQGACRNILTFLPAKAVQVCSKYTVVNPLFHHYFP